MRAQVMVARYGKTEETSYSWQRRLPRSAWWPTRYAGCRRAVVDSTEPTYGTSATPPPQPGPLPDPDLRSEVRQHEVDKQSGVVGGVTHVDDRVRAHPAARAEHNVLKSTVVSTPVTARKA